MFHLMAFYASIALNAVYQQLLAVADGGMTRNAGNQYVMPSNVNLIGSHVQGVTTSAAQVQAPSLRQIAYPEISPLVQAAITAPPTLPAFVGYGMNGPRFLMNEAVGVYASEGGTGASPTVAGLWITDNLVNAPPGQQITLVATATIVDVVQGWTLGTLTFSTQLAAGQYVVTGMGVIGAGANYARLVFPGQTNYRPGVLVDAAIGNKQWRDQFRMGRYGTFGTFQFNAPPQLETFGNAAASHNYTILLDVIKQ
jgi:hypothetical protein